MEGPHLGSMAAAPQLGYVPPDLSHLTEDERRIIQTVMRRQKAEEAAEADVLK